METKRRGRPPGSFKKIKEEKTPKFDISGTPKKRGRKKIEKIELAPRVEMLQGEPEGTTTEKLKVYAGEIKKIDEALNHEPYRMDMRMRKQDIINRMCFLIEGLA